MRGKFRLWPEDPVICDGRVRLGAVLEKRRGRSNIWFEVDEEIARDRPDSMDAFVLGVLFVAMQEKRDLMVHGTLSDLLLQNLHEFQQAWHCWLPDDYGVVDICPEEVAGPDKRGEAKGAIVAFSGGVDGAFSLYHNSAEPRSASTRDARAALLIQGFDIPTKHGEAFASVEKFARDTLDSIGLPLFTLKTNLKERLTLDWNHAFGASLAACLHLFAGRFEAGLIGSCQPYDKLNLPWGSNPVTDHLLSGRAFSIVYDGAAFSRMEKIAAIAGWDVACKHLRVCWEGKHYDRNCGHCEKCIRTMLNFLAVGHQIPPSFDSPPTEAAIARIRVRNKAQYSELEQVVEYADRQGITHPLIATLEKVLENEKRYPDPHQTLGGNPAYRRVYRSLRSLKKLLLNRS